MFSRLTSVVFFFFKQKTAYEMRISDWSSDVCSSDLLDFRRGAAVQHLPEAQVAAGDQPVAGREKDQGREGYAVGDAAAFMLLPLGEGLAGGADHLPRAGDPGGVGGG